MNEQIVILDFGAQYTQVIARRVRECSVYSTIIPFDTPAAKVAALKPSGIILSGGPASVYAEKPPLPDPGLFTLGVPVLGLCYGEQLLAHLLGGKVEKGLKREFGKGTLTIQDPACALFQGLPPEIQVWNSHGDKLTQLPEGFQTVATTENSPYAAIEHRAKKFFGVQFHPEVAHTPRGKEVISNFVHGVCGCGKQWTMRGYIDRAVEEIRSQVGSERVLLGLSGGVDSSVAAALLHKAIGDQLTCIFVNNGLLRAREAEVVQEVFGRNFQVKLQYEDASALFLKKLRGVTDPERKRKVIGKTFIDVFQSATKRAGQARCLAQGTLYPDVIESVPIDGNPAALIKSHHNVGGLPRNMKFELVEPLKCLFKDEVRQLGLELGLPQEIVWRQPFPGPGLAVRVLGEERTYDYTIAVRAVESQDGMTADWVKLPYDLLEKLATRIINEVKGVNRCVFDITSKPPGTIEWE